MPPKAPAPPKPFRLVVVGNSRFAANGAIGNAGNGMDADNRNLFTDNLAGATLAVFDLATAAFIARHEDSLLVGPPGSGKSHLAQAIGQAAIQQGYRVLYATADLGA